MDGLSWGHSMFQSLPIALIASLSTNSKKDEPPLGLDMESTSYKEGIPKSITEVAGQPPWDTADGCAIHVAPQNEAMVETTTGLPSDPPLKVYLLVG